MKYKSLFALAAASLTMLFACEKPVDLGPEEVTIVSSDVPEEIPVDGGEYTVELKATVDWELRGYDEYVQKWLSINPSSGKASASPQTIKIKALSNDGGATRKADLEIYGNPMARASLTITQLGNLVEDGTVEHPYSVASILALAEDSGWTNDNPSEELHVKGIVSRVKEYQLDTYGNISYYISDDGSESEELYVFGGYNFDCKRFTSEDELVKGDEVVICGQIVVYKGTVEFTDHNYLVLRNGEGPEVVPPADPVGDGTAENPYNVSGVMKYYEEHGWSSDNKSPEIYAKGKISYVVKFDDQYGSINYYISDDGTSNNEFYVYAGYNFNDTKFSGKDDLKIGDEVVIRGKITTYNGAPQFDMHNYLVSLNGETSGGETPDPEPEDPDPVPGDWIYSNSFNNGQGDFTIVDKTLPEALNYVWKHDGDFDCMKASAYVDNTNYATESWLISPVIDLTAETEAYLAFEHATNYFNTTTLADDASVWAREEGSEEWMKLTGVNYPASQGWTFVKSGDVDMSAFAGTKMQFAFVYKSSDSKAGTWEVKNVVVKDAAEEIVPIPDGSVVLTFPDDNSANNGLTKNHYETEWEAKIGEYGWDIYAFNNNDWENWTYIRAGRKNNVASVAYIATSTALPEISEVIMTVDKIDASLVKSIVLSVYSDAGLSQKVGEDIVPAGGYQAGDMSFEIPDTVQAGNLYYKLTLDLKGGSSNGFVQVSKVTYIAAE